MARMASVALRYPGTWRFWCSSRGWSLSRSAYGSEGWGFESLRARLVSSCKVPLQRGISSHVILAVRRRKVTGVSNRVSDRKQGRAVSC